MRLVGCRNSRKAAGSAAGGALILERRGWQGLQSSWDDGGALMAHVLSTATITHAVLLSCGLIVGGVGSV